MRMLFFRENSLLTSYPTFMIVQVSLKFSFSSVASISMNVYKIALIISSTFVNMDILEILVLVKMLWNLLLNLESFLAKLLITKIMTYDLSLI